MQCTMYSAQCTVCSAVYVYSTVYSTVYSVQGTVYSVYSLQLQFRSLKKFSVLRLKDSYDA